MWHWPPLRQGSEKQSLTSSRDASSNSSVDVGSGRTSDRDELVAGLTWQSMRLTVPEEDVNGDLLGQRMQNFCDVSG